MLYHKATVRSLVLAITLILGVTSIHTVKAQQGKYVRKSVSSVESVWIKPGAIDYDVRFDYDFFDNMVGQYIETNRFDYNQLPDTLLYEFRERANELETVNPETIKGVLEETVVQEILSILNDPEVKKRRAEGLQSEADLQSFAATKAKSTALTADQLATLMNSAYIYLPYIDQVTDDPSQLNMSAVLSGMFEEATGTDDDDLIQMAIKGGIVWYNVKVAPDGSTSLKLIKNTETSAVGAADETENKDFRYGDQTYDVSPMGYAFYDATQAWAKNLGVQTKEIEDFKLSAQVVEAQNKEYSLPLSRQDGVHLDDTFFLIQNVQEDGETKEKRVGFVRITDLDMGDDDSKQYSKATQLLGSGQSPGVVAEEHPRYGMNLNLRFSGINGINVTQAHSAVFDNGVYRNVLNEDASAGYGGTVNFSYNLAPIIGVSQSFFDLELSYHAFNAEANTNASVAPYLFSAYVGAKKKFWFGRYFTSLDAGVGFDRFGMSGTYAGEDLTLGLNSVGANFGGELGVLLSPNWSLHAGVGYKVASDPLTWTYEWGDWEAAGIASDRYSDMNLGGVTFKFGVTYSLRQLPFNVLGFLDGFKKY